MITERKAIKSKYIFTGLEMLTEKAIIFVNDRIEAIVDNDQVPENIMLYDFQDSIIAPGLIDLQIYGGGGYLFSQELTAQSLHAIADYLVSTGTTGFVITLATNSMEVFRQAASIVRSNPHPAVLGLHFEGPFINPGKKGAHLEQFIKSPSKKEIEELVHDTGDVLKIVTLAPECVDPGYIQLFTDAGIIVSAGHSDATYTQAKAGFENGIRLATHLFNAMSSMHHRDVGMPGAVFLDKQVQASIIADGIHVDYATVAISKQILGDRLFLITDAVEEVKEGSYVHHKQADRYTLPDGTLSGSRLTLLKAVKNCVHHAGITTSEALRMASAYPAKILSMNDRGIIRKDNYADFIVFDGDYELVASFLRGKSLHM